MQLLSMNSRSGASPDPSRALKMPSPMRAGGCGRTDCRVSSSGLRCQPSPPSARRTEARGRSHSTLDDHRHAACPEHPSVKVVRSEPTAHRKTKRNQTSQRLLAEPLNHNSVTWEIQLLGPDPSHESVTAPSLIGSVRASGEARENQQSMSRRRSPIFCAGPSGKAD